MIRGRIAPTPSGFLHLGNAFNFILTWLMVRHEKGLLRLRIDDLDAPRANPEYIEDLFRVLDWLGLDWDEGPQGPDAHSQHFSQQHRLERYHRLIGELETKQQVFACECSRSQLSGYAQYPGHCRSKHLPFTTPETALRVFTPEDVITHIHDQRQGEVTISLYHEMRDFVVRRRDGIPAYQIATLADDTDHGINLIVRGTDLLQSTAAQLHLAAILELDAFKETRFYHHPLVTDEHGNKLSKSAGSFSLKSWREQQLPVAELYKAFCSWMRWPAQAGSMQELSALYAEHGH